MNNIKIGSPAPFFTADSTGGKITFPNDFSGKWMVLYFFVCGFCPVSASDILKLSDLLPKLHSYSANVLGISPDSVPSLIAWLMSLRSMRGDGKAVGFDIVTDCRLKNSTKFDIFPNDEKAVVIVDPDGIIRAFHKYPQGIGINTTEIERILLSLQSTKTQNALAPANWIPGSELLDLPPSTLKEALSSVTDKEKLGHTCLDWYICKKQDTGER